MNSEKSARLGYVTAMKYRIVNTSAIGRA